MKLSVLLLATLLYAIPLYDILNVLDFYSNILHLHTTVPLYKLTHIRDVLL